jgi:uncharacterized membrane protein
MNMRTVETDSPKPNLESAKREAPNGSGAAALLSAAVGCLFFATLALIADKTPAIKTLMIFYKPTGPLSGVTMLSIVVWLVCWLALEARWRNREVALRKISRIAVGLLLLSVLLTFPPFADLF